MNSHNIDFQLRWRPEIQPLTIVVFKQHKDNALLTNWRRNISACRIRLVKTCYASGNWTQNLLNFYKSLWGEMAKEYTYMYIWLKCPFCGCFTLLLSADLLACGQNFPGSPLFHVCVWYLVGNEFCDSVLDFVCGFGDVVTMGWSQWETTNESYMLFSKIEYIINIISISSQS